MKIEQNKPFTPEKPWTPDVKAEEGEAPKEEGRKSEHIMPCPFCHVTVTSVAATESSPPTPKEGEGKSMEGILREHGMNPPESFETESYWELYDDMKKAMQQYANSRTEKLVEAVEKAIKEQDQIFKAHKDEADWYNNNASEVGITHDYKTYPPLPDWVKNLNQALKEHNSNHNP